MAPKKLTLREWNSRLPRPRSEETVRRWVRAGKIYPVPVLDGREYFFDENAVRIDPQNPRASLHQGFISTRKKPYPIPIQLSGAFVESSFQDLLASTEALWRMRNTLYRNVPGKRQGIRRATVPPTCS
ncbi:excisionase [Serratia fonticola]|uniref:excisionase n=1 Tax=Serratia fonticola TaxID=47917 RepID=UPI003AF3B21E